VKPWDQPARLQQGAQATESERSMSEGRKYRPLVPRAIAVIALAAIIAIYLSGEQVVVGIVNLVSVYVASLTLIVGIVLLLGSFAWWLLRPFQHRPGDGASP